jgi:hypothetical protein
MSRQGGLYNDDGIDVAAKALLPIVDRMFEKGERIDQSDFADSYVTTATAALGPRLTGPRVALQELAVLIDSSLVESDVTFMPMMLKTLPTIHSLWSYRLECCTSEFVRWWSFHAPQPRLVIVRTTQRPEAAALFDDVQPPVSGYSIRGARTPVHHYCGRRRLAGIDVVRKVGCAARTLVGRLSRRRFALAR